MGWRSTTPPADYPGLRAILPINVVGADPLFYTAINPVGLIASARSCLLPADF